MPPKALSSLHKSAYTPNSGHGSAKKLPRLGRDIGSVFATWELDVKCDRLCWTIALPDIAGLGAPDLEPDLSQFLALIHPSDRGSFVERLAAARSGVPFEMSLRIQCQNPLPLVLHVEGVPICDRSGKVTSVLGLCRPSKVKNRGSLNRRNEVLLSQAERIANFGTWSFDVRSRLGAVSPHLAHMLGIRSGLRLSEEDYWSKVHPGDRDRVMEIARAALAKDEPFEYSARCLVTGGEIRHHFVRGVPVRDTNGDICSIYGIVYDFSDQTHAEGELQRLSQKLLRARDDERRNVARELHESTGQTLAALKMSLGRLREAMPDDERLHRLLGSAVELAEDAVREVRTLSYLMHPAMLDEAGLRSALHWYVKGFAERSGISIDVNVPDDFGRHGQEIETTIFRIVQEALTNIHRYSGSRTASVSLVRGDDRVSAIIQDKGCGLPALSSPRGQVAQLGVGIVGMRERVKQLNGTFEMESSPGKGTTVRIVLPINPRDSSC